MPLGVIDAEGNYLVNPDKGLLGLRILLSEILKVNKKQRIRSVPNLEVLNLITYPTKTQLSNFLGTPGEDYLKGNPKSLNFYFLVIWWGKIRFFRGWGFDYIGLRYCFA